MGYVHYTGAEMPEHIKIHSEGIEPGFAYMIGRWWAQAEWAKKQYGRASFEHIEKLEHMWYGLSLQSRLAGICDAIHATIATTNHEMMVSRMIEKELGFSPIRVEAQPENLHNNYLDFFPHVTVDWEDPEGVDNPPE